MRRFIFQEAAPTEYEDLKRFYETNPDRHVMLRPQVKVAAALKRGSFIVVQDTSLPSDSRIVAAGAVYDVPIQEESLEQLLNESGGDLHASTHQGFGLHGLTVSARVLHRLCLEPDGFDGYFSAIVSPNDKSARTYLKLGFSPWLSPPASLVAERAPFAQAGEQVLYYRLPLQAVPGIARSFLEKTSRGLVERRIDGQLEQVETVFHLDILQYYRPVLEKLAKGDLSELEERIRPAAKFTPPDEEEVA